MVYNLYTRDLTIRNMTINVVVVIIFKKLKKLYIIEK